MKFEWDEQKHQTNIRKHGFSFADAWEIFEAPMLVDLDDRFDYGEDRWIGSVDCDRESLRLSTLNWMKRRFGSSRYERH